MTPTAARTAAFPEALDPVADRVETCIDALLAAEQKRWSEVDAALGEPLDALRDFVAAGGKRLRPAFCACAFVGAGGALDDHAVVDAAAALELVHTFALVHDDIMDGSEIRRGRDAVHRQFARQHEDASWRGPARRFGDGMAILVGDFALVYADILLRGAPDAAQAIFDELRIELCVGQSLDLVGTATARTDAATARRIATYKSGKYTVERPLHLGAALAGRLRRARRRRSRRSGCRWARRSSSATTCSARSARPRSPASRSATTSARASRHRSSRSPAPARDRRATASCWPSSARPT